MAGEEYNYPSKIISGGQSGADFAGLVAGKCLGLETGGIAPQGYRTEFGSNPYLREEFGLVEDTSSSYKPRTVKNVQNSDGTVWFGKANSPGGKLTLSTCEKEKKPFFINPAYIELRCWLHDKEIETLNVAGNRSSTNPGIFDTAFIVLMDAIKK